AISNNLNRIAPSQISGYTCLFTNTNVRSVTTALRRFRSSPILTLRSVRGVEAQSNSCSRLPQFSSKGRVGMSRTTPKSQVRPPNNLPTAVPPIKVRRLKKRRSKTQVGAQEKRKETLKRSTVGCRRFIHLQSRPATGALGKLFAALYILASYVLKIRSSPPGVLIGRSRWNY